MPAKPTTDDEATAKIVADLDYYAQLMLAGALPQMPQRPCDATPPPVS